MSKFQRGDHIRVPIKNTAGFFSRVVPAFVYPHRNIYHHGIHVGNKNGRERVICLVFDSPEKGVKRAFEIGAKGGKYKIDEVTLEDFAKNVNAKVADIEKSPRFSILSKLFREPYSKEDIACRAEARHTAKEKGRYKLLGPGIIDHISGNAKQTLNCEMFARECETGERATGQQADLMNGATFLVAIGLFFISKNEGRR